MELVKFNTGDQSRPSPLTVSPPATPSTDLPPMLAEAFRRFDRDNKLSVVTGADGTLRGANLRRSLPIVAIASFPTATVS